MIWKVIGQSVIGTSHISSAKDCEDAIRFKTATLPDGEQALICFVSDGAGSAKYAKEAAETAVGKALEASELLLAQNAEIDTGHLIQIAETIYGALEALAVERQAPLNDFSCTFLGALILPRRACFLQIGDGAIVRADDTGFYSTLWWPHNGEYQNTTTFLIDDRGFGNLQTRIIEERIDEIAIFSDGLQMLALNNESESVHQPFFVNLFKALRLAGSGDHIAILNGKLLAYLSGGVINSRTDDDKTLLLATRIKHDSPVV
jgi:Protein phosphatase 2C